MNHKEQILLNMNQEELIELTSQLVSIPSHYKVPGGETRVARVISERLRAENISSEVEEVFDERCNVWASLPGTDPKAPSLLLCGHLDTVLAEGMDHEPFSGMVKDGKLWGRGAADMKGGNAAMLYAMMAIKRSGISLKGDLIYAGLVGEESPNNSEGARYWVSHHKRTDYAIVGEATGLNVAGYHKGMSWLKVHIQGKASHASKPTQGINAVSVAARMIAALEDELLPQLALRKHDYVAPPTLSIGKISGGLQNNTVPHQCWFSMDRRYIPGENIAQVKGEIEEILQSVVQRYPGASFYIEEEPETQGRETLESGIDNALAETLVGCIKDVTGRIVKPGGVDYWTDGAHLARMNTKTVVFGPGNIAQAHAATEFIDIQELFASAKIYALLAMQLLGV